ncbi:Rv3235 family protein [Promicromonospora sp. NPDC019610]|uniref:Rv3235 family protein n=1 Tax=Promicromonospora sp. NPDC019610 TaxID=3364405 RepID=UPI0037A41996
MTTLDSPPEATAPVPEPAPPSRTRRTAPRPAATAGATAPPAQRTAVPPAGPVTGPGIGRRLRRMRIGGTPYPELQNAAAALEALSGRPVPEPDPTLPDPTAQVCRVVRAAVEVLRGERPAAQLARWVTPQVYDQLLERGRLMREARQVRPTRPRAHPAAVRRVRLVRLGASSAEATVILHDEGRVRAAAVRLEARRGVWRVAVLEIG